jgi:hypothetical protein
MIFKHKVIFRHVATRENHSVRDTCKPGQETNIRQRLDINIQRKKQAGYRIRLIYSTVITTSKLGARYFKVYS